MFERSAIATRRAFGWAMFKWPPRSMADPFRSILIKVALGMAIGALEHWDLRTAFILPSSPVSRLATVTLFHVAPYRKFWRSSALLASSSPGF